MHGNADNPQSRSGAQGAAARARGAARAFDGGRGPGYSSQHTQGAGAAPGDGSVSAHPGALRAARRHRSRPSAAGAGARAAPLRLMFLLDTNVLSAVMGTRPAPQVANWMAQHKPKWLFTAAV